MGLPEPLWMNFMVVIGGERRAVSGHTKAGMRGNFMAAHWLLPLLVLALVLACNSEGIWNVEGRGREGLSGSDGVSASSLGLGERVREKGDLIRVECFALGFPCCNARNGGI